MRAPGGPQPDLRDIKGQESAKRALEVAAAGGHNLLMSGSPGAGKSMLAQRLPSILPVLTPRELLEVSMIHSVAGALAGGALTDRRPFRAPHHSASTAALVGGGIHAKPGEISLSHNGVLFLDELPEFQPQVLDSRASRWRPARSRSRALIIALSIPPVSSSWQQYIRADAVMRTIRDTHARRRRTNAALRSISDGCRGR